MIPEPGIPFAYAAPIPDQSLTQVLANEAKHKLDSLAMRLMTHGLKVDTAVLVRTGVGQAIVEYAREHAVDLVALSSHGRGATRLFMGSVADKVIRGSGIPVLIRRPIGSPIAENAPPGRMAGSSTNIKEIF
jgi:nucleotide-binding universal stress UspA family protein